MTLDIGPPTIGDIHAAADRLDRAILQTPCLPSETLSAITGARLFLKFENLQFTASFKERGALNKLLLDAAGRIQSQYWCQKRTRFFPLRY